MAALPSVNVALREEKLLCPGWWCELGGGGGRKGPELWVKGEESPCASFRMGA